MQLIGMLDSPYVRRVAIALRLLGIDFEHRPLSVFRSFEQFAAINPVVKAPTLVCDDGTVLMDSSLILQYAQAVAPARRSLLPAAPEALCRELHLSGLALAACDRGVQIFYERTLRPPEKHHEPWMARVRGQLGAAIAGLEVELSARPLAPSGAASSQAGVDVAVVWGFLQRVLAETVVAAASPALVAHAAAAEALPAFRALPQT